jgi:uncharacterized protein YjbI with pentapeptide repeats
MNNIIKTIDTEEKAILAEFHYLEILNSLIENGEFARAMSVARRLRRTERRLYKYHKKVHSKISGSGKRSLNSLLKKSDIFNNQFLVKLSQLLPTLEDQLNKENPFSLQQIVVELKQILRAWVILDNSMKKESLQPEHEDDDFHKLLEKLLTEDMGSSRFSKNREIWNSLRSKTLGQEWIIDNLDIVSRQLFLLDFRGVTLRNISLRDCDILLNRVDKTNFDKVKIMNSSLNCDNLEGSVNFNRCQIHNCLITGRYTNYNFNEVDFNGSDIHNAQFTKCFFIKCNLKKVKMNFITKPELVRDPVFNDSYSYPTSCDFTRCTFERSVFDGSAINFTIFNICVFKITTFNRAQFDALMRDPKNFEGNLPEHDSRFERCTFHLNDEQNPFRNSRLRGEEINDAKSLCNSCGFWFKGRRLSSI